MSAKDDAKALVDQFSAGPDADVWPNIAKSDLIEPMKARIDNPDKINQSQTNLCGPADFVRDLVTDRPVDYVNAIISLYLTGRAKIKDLNLKPCSDLKTHKLATTNPIAPVDWIFLASIRDSDNWVVDYQSTDDATSAVTLPHSKEKWLKDAGYTDVKNEANILFTKDLKNAREASALFSKGYKVALLIDADMLENDQQKVDSGSAYPDHWIALKSVITITGIEADPISAVSFEAYTWGSTRKVPCAGLKMYVKPFLRKYYGYVAAKM